MFHGMQLSTYDIGSLSLLTASDGMPDLCELCIYGNDPRQRGERHCTAMYDAGHCLDLRTAARKSAEGALHRGRGESHHARAHAPVLQHVCSRQPLRNYPPIPTPAPPRRQGLAQRAHAYSHIRLFPRVELVLLLHDGRQACRQVIEINNFRRQRKLHTLVVVPTLDAYSFDPALRVPRIKIF
eukprot:6225284-Prymnesium_polylepis.2